MRSSDRKILNQFAARVRALFPEARIWAFGSRARDDAEPDSDMDICIVVEDYSDEADDQISHVAWEVGFEHDVLITTVVYSAGQFERGPLSFSPLVRAVRREGVPA
jgi:predicted nucleotidyltransferase